VCFIQKFSFIRCVLCNDAVTKFMYNKKEKKCIECIKEIKLKKRKRSCSENENELKIKNKQFI
jgi:hypothetical protein